MPVTLLPIFNSFAIQKWQHKCFILEERPDEIPATDFDHSNSILVFFTNSTVLPSPFPASFRNSFWLRSCSFFLLFFFSLFSLSLLPASLFNNMNYAYGWSDRWHLVWSNVRVASVSFPSLAFRISLGVKGFSCCRPSVQSTTESDWLTDWLTERAKVTTTTPWYLPGEREGENEKCQTNKDPEEIVSELLGKNIRYV